MAAEALTEPAQVNGGCTSTSLAHNPAECFLHYGFSGSLNSFPQVLASGHTGDTPCAECDLKVRLDIYIYISISHKLDKQTFEGSMQNWFQDVQMLR